MQPRAGTQVSRGSRAILIWALHAGAVLAVAGAFADAVVLSIYGATWVTRAACVLASAALGLLVGVIAAPPAALLAAAVAHLRATRLGRWLWPATIGLVACVVLWSLLDPLERQSSGPYVVIIVLASSAVALAAWLAQAQPRSLARAVLIAIATAALALEAQVGRYWYLELHDTSDVVVVAALLALTAGAQRALARRRIRVLLAATLGALVCACVLLASIDDAFPGWRSLASFDAHNLRRHGQLLRSLADRDRDGYAAILWGGDCHDGDASVHPGAADPPGGGDDNCNGVDPPAAPSDAARGLAPARGEPALAAGRIQRLVLITVDTWRNDAFVPELMPELSRLARTGLNLTRTYAGGSATRISVPLWFKPAPGAAGVVSELRAAGIRSTAVLHGLRNVIDDYRAFDRVVHAAGARKTTDAALREVEGTAGTRSLVWVHYFGLHSPGPELARGAPASPEHLPARYRGAARVIDREVGRLVQRLQRADLADTTLIVVSADHGDAAGEHGVHMHGASGFEEVVRVPLFLVGADLPACDHPHTVSARSVPATLLGAFGLHAQSEAAEWLGRSLLRLRAGCREPLQTHALTHSARYTSGQLTFSRLGVLVDDQYKLVVGIEDGLVELYDHRSDPREEHELSSLRPDAVRSRLPMLSLLVDLEGDPRRPIR